jgi:hypothetical protein
MDTPNNNETIPPSPFTPEQLRLLKLAVIGMGVILLVGFSVVIGRIIYLVNATPAKTPVEGAIAQSLAVPPALVLPKGAVVRHLAISGSRLAVHFDGPAGQGLHIIDLAGGGQGIRVPIIEDGAAGR